MVHVNFFRLRIALKHWVTQPRNQWHDLWYPLWKLWESCADYDEEDYSLNIYHFNDLPLRIWQTRLLSVVFNYDYWYYESVELCPWQNEVKEFGIPYHSRF